MNSTRRLDDSRLRKKQADEMIGALVGTGVVSSGSDLKQAILDREEESSTAIGMNIAISHGKSEAVLKPSVVFGMKRSGVWTSILFIVTMER